VLGGDAGCHLILDCLGRDKDAAIMIVTALKQICGILREPAKF